MKCHQCDRPALYLTGENKEIPVCLMCQEKIEHIQHLQFTRAAAALNQALNDMDYIMPIAPTVGRMPVAELASAMKKSHTYNNISINNSQVGVVNTGDLAKIDAAITLSQGSDLESLGKILQQFTQSVMSCHELSQTRKQEIVDLIQALSSQAFSDRKPSVLRSLARSIIESVKDVSILAASAESLAHTVHDLFPVAT